MGNPMNGPRLGLAAALASLGACIPMPQFVQGVCASGAAPAEREIPADCETRLDRAFAASRFDSVVLMDGEEVVYRAGDHGLPSNVASVRKSIVSVLFGMAADRGLVDLDASLQDIGIDDATNPLTPEEQQATIRQLLQARSGVYLPALGQNWPNDERGSHPPGEQFWYNNWDFNVSGTIFEQETGLTLERATMEWLAEPLGMQTFCPDHLRYQQRDSVSEHAIYRFYMNAEDLALIGALVSQGGVWQGETLVSESWLDESLAEISDLADLQNQYPPASPDDPVVYDGYGYMWWLQSSTGYAWANGAEGQRLLVDRATGLTSVGRNNSGVSAAGEAWYAIAQWQEFYDEGGLEAELEKMHELALECAR